MDFTQDLIAFDKFEEEATKEYEKKVSDELNNTLSKIAIKLSSINVDWSKYKKDFYADYTEVIFSNLLKMRHFTPEEMMIPENMWALGMISYPENSKQYNNLKKSFYSLDFQQKVKFSFYGATKNSFRLSVDFIQSFIEDEFGFVQNFRPRNRIALFDDFRNKGMDGKVINGVFSLPILYAVKDNYDDLESVSQNAIKLFSNGFEPCLIYFPDKDNSKVSFIKGIKTKGKLTQIKVIRGNLVYNEDSREYLRNFLTENEIVFQGSIKEQMLSCLKYAVDNGWTNELDENGNQI